MKKVVVLTLALVFLAGAVLAEGSSTKVVTKGKALAKGFITKRVLEKISAVPATCNFVVHSFNENGVPKKPRSVILYQQKTPGKFQKLAEGNQQTTSFKHSAGGLFRIMAVLDDNHKTALTEIHGDLGHDYIVDFYYELK